MKYLYLTRRHCPTIARVEIVDLAPNYVRVRLHGVKASRREAWLTTHHEYHTEYAEAKRVLLFDLDAKWRAAADETNLLHQQWLALGAQTEADLIAQYEKR